MSRILKILVALVVLALVGVISLKTGLARQAFFELFAFVKGVDVLGPTVVRVPPHDSPYQRLLVTWRST